MKPNQIRKYRRYGEIPGAFFHYLKEAGVIPEDTNIHATKTGRSREDLSVLLKCCSYEAARPSDTGESIEKPEDQERHVLKIHDTREHILKLLLIEWCPDMAKLFPNGTHQYKPRP